MDDSEHRKENTSDLLRLFVYGTLKRGYWNHDRFCEGALEVRDAWIRGQLYEGPGFPLLEVPDEDVLAHGTDEPLADVATQARLSARVGSSPSPAPKAPQRAHGAPCTGSLLPLMTQKPDCQPSTGWRASTRAVTVSTSACWSLRR